MCGSGAAGSRNSKFPEMKDAFQVLQNMGIGEGEGRRLLSLLRGKDQHAISTMLRDRNAKLYSHAALADLSAFQRRRRIGGRKE